MEKKLKDSAHAGVPSEEGKKVAVIKCKSYSQKEVDKAVNKALDLIDFRFKKGMKVLLKPNIVSANVKDIISTITNPAIVEAVCKILKKNGCKIFVGESSFMSTDSNFKISGIEKIAKKYNAKLVIFEQDKLIKLKDWKAKVLKEFPVSKTLKEADLIINLPKMKTHILTKYTGGIKNLYGVIPGGLKQSLHNKAKGEKNFSELLVDIYQNIKPGLNIMDGIVGMEGQGPTSGKAKKAGLILCSKNTVALDIAATRIMGLNPKKVWTINYAVKRGLYPGYNFDLVGMKGKLPLIKFRKPRSDINISRLRRVFGEKPIVVDEKKCIQCGLCAKKCPAKAIRLDPYPIINRKKCIRCFCCMEVCPKHALNLKD